MDRTGRPRDVGSSSVVSSDSNNARNLVYLGNGSVLGVGCDTLNCLEPLTEWSRH